MSPGPRPSAPTREVQLRVQLRARAFAACWLRARTRLEPPQRQRRRARRRPQQRARRCSPRRTTASPRAAPANGSARTPTSRSRARSARKCRRRGAGSALVERDRVMPPAARHVEQVAGLEHAIEHGRRLAETWPLFSLRCIAERQRQRRWIDLPAFAADQLNSEHVVRVPMLAERAASADRQIRVARRPCDPANRPTELHNAQRAQRVVLEAVHDERRAISQLLEEATFVELPPRRRRARPRRPCIAPRRPSPLLKKPQDGATGSIRCSAASSSGHANASPRSADFSPATAPSRGSRRGIRPA